MKKIVFGQTEEHVPSKYCHKINYHETKIQYPVHNIVFYTMDSGCVLELPMREGEHFFGLGLQLKTFDHTGKKVSLRVNADPITLSGESHAPVPFFVSTAGYGIYLDTARYAQFYFGEKKACAPGKTESDSRIKISVDELYKASESSNEEKIIIHIPTARGITLYIMEGKTITDIVAQYNMLSGGGCDVPEWGLGFLYRCCANYSQERILQTAKYFKKRGIPCSIIGLEPGWQSCAYSCSYVWNKDRFPNPREMLDELNEMGYHVNLWEHAFVHPQSPIYQELKDKSGNFEVWNGLVPDFSLPESRHIFAEFHKNETMLNRVDGFKLDECDDSDNTGGWSFPLCSRFPSGMDGEQYHSLFGTLYMQTILQALNGTQTLSEVRNAGALCSSYPFVLYSDLYDHKDFIRGLATAGFSGLLWTPEVRNADSKEEFLKRLQTVVFSPQCLINGWYCEELPWMNLECEEELCHWLKQRYILIPKIKTAFDKYRHTGIPVVRAVVSDFSDDPNTYNLDNQYLFCDDLLIAPAFTGETHRNVYIPEGKWKNYFTGEGVLNGWTEYISDQILVFQKDQ